MIALYGPVLSDPRIVAALSEREREFERARREVQDMLTQPEWN
jgi:hypothetical protein